MMVLHPPATPMAISLLGPFSLQVDGTPLPRLRSHRLESILALLILRHARPVERAWLAGLLWPESSQSRGLATLRRYLTELRQVLGPEARRLHSPTRSSLLFDHANSTVDLITFDAAIARGDPSSLQEAVSLYRGPLLEDWREEWVFQERQAREQSFLSALVKLAAAARLCGDLEAAETHLRRVVGVDPLRESARRELMKVLAVGGNYAAVLQVYRELRLLLHREMNAEPDAESTALFQQFRAEARRRTLAPLPVGPSPLPPLPPRSLSEPPAAEGTLTFLFTDLEGSSQLWEQHPVAMRDALSRHDALLRQVIEAHDGTIFKTMGDQFCAAFATAPEALGAALAAQQALVTEAWGATGPPRVRMALHTGAAQQREGDYFGPPLNRVARLLSAGHGGQILLSWVTQELAREQLPVGTRLLDLGEHRLKDLGRAERIFQVIVADRPQEFPPLDTLERRRHHLPVQPTPLIGREKELDAALACLRRDTGTGEGGVRLLTLTGPGGTGKTRLGLQIAAELLDEFPDGVFFVNLAPITDPALIVPTIAHVLEVREVGNRSLQESLTEYLREKQVLLVLDNFEQVIAAAPLVAELLAAAPRLKVLATSREMLHLRGEQEFPVPPLAQPDLKRLPTAGAALVAALSQYAAVELFIQRALAVKPDFAVTNDNAPAVAEICTRLDGLPLAIELAAARAKLFSPAALLSRLSQPLKLLTGGARDLPARQQTLRGTIAWSYDLLEEPEKTVFRRLSVFVGGVTLEAAEDVCDADGDLLLDVLDGIASLAGKSLLQQEEPAGEEPRFVMLETIREFGAECLAASGEEAAVRDQHRAYFLNLAERAAPALEGPDQIAWLNRLEAEHDNLRAALSWAEERGETEILLRFGASLWEFWRWRNRWGEGIECLERGLAAGGEAIPPRLRARALLGLGMLCWLVDSHRMGTALEEAADLFRELGDPRGIGYSLCGLQRVRGWAGDNAQSQALGEEGLAAARQSGDRYLLAFSLFVRAVTVGGHDFPRALALSEEDVAVSRQLGNPRMLGSALYSRGEFARAEGDWQRAAALMAEGEPIQRQLGSKWFLAFHLGHQGELLSEMGEHRSAVALLEESLDLFRDVQDPGGVADSLRHLGDAACRAGDLAKARSFYEKSQARAPEDKLPRFTAGSLCGLARVALRQGEAGRAGTLVRESLTIWWERKDERGIARCLEVLAQVAMVQGLAERMTRLFGAAEALRERIHWPLGPADQADDTVVPADGAVLGKELFTTAFAAGCVMTLEQAVAYALEDGSDDTSDRTQ